MINICKCKAKKTGIIRLCVGFIDRTVIGIARPSEEMEQRVVYNGHKENIV